MPKLDVKFFAIAERPAKGRVIYWDDAIKGFGLMVMASGHKSFVVQYRVAKKLRRMTLPSITKPKDARDLALSILGDVAKGRVLRQPIDPLAERQELERDKSGVNSFETIARKWFGEDDGAKQRSAAQRLAALDRLAFPTLGKRPINKIERIDVINLIDEIAEKHGPSMADYVLSAIRRVMSWYALRDSKFTSPIVSGMTKTSATKQARQRILKDEELRAVWRAAGADRGPYGALVRFLLLTATRREEAAQMRRSELAGNEWTIPEDRYKTGYVLVVPLSSAAWAVLDSLPRIGRGDLVFTSDGRRPLGGFSVRKAAFDTACGVTGWTLHDLRRTARSLMSRAGIPTDIAERCLGHIITGVRGTYDRHAYINEKREAFEKLAKLISVILTPPAD
jgi:integrase